MLTGINGALSEALRGQRRVGVGGRFTSAPTLGLIADGASAESAEQTASVLRTMVDEVSGAPGSAEFNFPDDLPAPVRVPRSLVRQALAGTSGRAFIAGARPRIGESLW